MKNLLMIAIILSLFSCSKDDSVDNSSSTTPTTTTPSTNNIGGTKLKSEKKTQSSGFTEWTKTYEYNSQGYLSKITMTTIYDDLLIRTFDYDSNNELISYTEDVINGFGDVYQTNFYPEYLNGVIVRVCSEVINQDGYDNRIDKTEYSYSSNNISLFTYYNDMQLEYNTCESLSSISSTITQDYDSDGNMIKREYGGGSTTYIGYTYDDKSHPYANVKPINYMKLQQASAINNVVSSKSYYLSDNSETGNYENFEPTYNLDGFPISIKKTFSSTSTYVTYEYTYY